MCNVLETKILTATIASFKYYFFQYISHNIRQMKCSYLSIMYWYQIGIDTSYILLNFCLAQQITNYRMKRLKGILFSFCIVLFSKGLRLLPTLCKMCELVYCLKHFWKNVSLIRPIHFQKRLLSIWFPIP
jgi:hypothetical protein